MKHFQTYQVFPAIPEQLSFLETLSRNLWWCWEHDAIDLFRRVDPRLWKLSGRNPIVFATYISQKRLEQLAKDDSYLAHLSRVKAQFESRVKKTSDLIPKEFDSSSNIAYFSMEFGIHESLPLFAGGLGILAGDHLKASSTLGLPLIGVGLLYREGYFRQYLNQDGWQQELYPETDLYHIPLKRVKNEHNDDLLVSVKGPFDRDIVAQVWTVMVGRIPLILLDTNLPDNPPQIRDITARLYAGELHIRLAQEVLLGIGGLRALSAMGIYPTLCHLNEGHCAFVGFERISQVMNRENVDFDTAMEIVPRTTVFTTHTPVAAGHDEFSPEMVRPYISSFASIFGMKEEDLISWGQKSASSHEPFSMFNLALRIAQYCNGVSSLHGRVARQMWAHVWPNRSIDEIPIKHITNGVHISSIISPEIGMLFDRYLGPKWHLCSLLSENIERIDEIYDEELWRAHELSRSRLIRAVRELMVKQYGRRNAPLSVMKTIESVLDQDTLTIGFARRFATYKRATLVFRDPERLESLLNSKDRPVQFIFAGKAHPKDNEGKQLIQNLIQFSQRLNVRFKIVFLEDYDLRIARMLVQGVDVWLNTPRRPLEACGTSGMKAAANGVLNLSILDGWWCEGYSQERGWRIGNGEEYEDRDYQDSIESQALYNILENDVIPCYYDRSSGGAPHTWIRKMKASMKMAMKDYCSFRMVKEYKDNYYITANEKLKHLTYNSCEEAKSLSLQHKRLKKCWNMIRIEHPIVDNRGPFLVNDKFQVTTTVYLGELKPHEVSIELYYGRMKSLDLLTEGEIATMTVKEDKGYGIYIYYCDIECKESGRYGFTVRAVPQADDWIRFRPGLITWV